MKSFKKYSLVIDALTNPKHMSKPFNEDHFRDAVSEFLLGWGIDFQEMRVQAVEEEVDV